MKHNYLITRSAILLQFLLSYTCANATTMVSANLAQISTQAESAFVINITKVELVTSGSQAYDLVSGIIVEPVFGNVSTSETKTWRQFRYSKQISFPGMPKYQPGKEYLIFLSGPGKNTGYQSPMALGQGMFTVHRNPQSGTAIVRNAYMNSTLSAGLNIDAVATTIIQRKSGTKAGSTAAKSTDASRLKTHLRGGPATSLQVVKEAAQFFREEKLRGRNPANDYFTTAPVRLLH